MKMLTQPFMVYITISATDNLTQKILGSHINIGNALWFPCFTLPAPAFSEEKPGLSRERFELRSCMPSSLKALSEGLRAHPSERRFSMSVYVCNNIMLELLGENLDDGAVTVNY